ncbi:MAG: nucleotidyltransferase family protein [Candidatus Aenigmarchaeota archaeon]|nr:nucleotidyltransferase family protein [Candidatus Aenigmarchaeota archaeon]
MKAVILAGGHGTRGKPFTDYWPKPMIPINDRPTIDYIVRYLSKSPEIDEIIIICNLDNDGHGNQIKNYFEGKESLLKKKITYIDDKFEGTGGALLRAKDLIKNDDEFLVWFSDNLCALDIGSLVKFYRNNRSIGCIAVTKRRKEESGFVKLDGNGAIHEFKEKPTVELNEPECLAIYILNKRILDYIEKEIKQKPSVNLSFDILQKMPPNEKLFAFDIGDNDWVDIESPIKVERNIDVIRKIIEQMDIN